MKLTQFTNLLLALSMLASIFSVITAVEEVRRTEDLDMRRTAYHRKKKRGLVTTRAPRALLSTKAPTSCTDNKEKFDAILKGTVVEANCGWWLERNPTARCANYQYVKENCPESCGTCGSTCEDTAENFEATFNGDVIRANCGWWLERNPTARCANYGNVKENCPKSCGTCGSTCEDTVGNFEATFNGDVIRANCGWWLERNPTARCANYGNVKEKCPKSCGTCGDTTPTESPVKDTPCEDVEGRFELDSVEWQVKPVGCPWVANKNTEWRCTVEEVIENCPKTCGLC